MRSKVATLPSTPTVHARTTIPDAPAVRSVGRTDTDHKVVTRDRVYRLKYRGEIIDVGVDYHQLKEMGDRLYDLGRRDLVIVTTEGYELCTWGLG